MLSMNRRAWSWLPLGGQGLRRADPRGGRSKRVRVGRHGDVSPDRARKEVARLIARLKAGAPLEADALPPTVAVLADQYLREYVDVHNKPATAAHYRLMLGKHIVPVLGALAVEAVERKDILALQYGLRDKPAVANRAVDMLVKVFNLADLWKMRPSGRYPCKAVRRYKVEPHKERFLTPEELARLGRVLDIAPTERLASRHAAAAIRLLVLTGYRRKEILGLRWGDIDFDAGELSFSDSKTGARIVPIPPAAAEVLSAFPCVPDNAGVITTWSTLPRPPSASFTSCANAHPRGATAWSMRSPT